METTTVEVGNDPLLNPVMKDATIIWRLRNTPGASDSTQIHHFLQDGVLTRVVQTKTLRYLRSIAHSIGDQ